MLCWAVLVPLVAVLTIPIWASCAAAPCRSRSVLHHMTLLSRWSQSHHSTQRVCLLSTTSGSVWLLRRHVSLYAAQTPFLHAVLARCPSLRTVYTSPWWLCNGHTETIFAWATRKSPNVVYYRRCLSLADGGVLALDYDDSPESQVPPLDAQLSTIILAHQSSTHAGADTTTCAGAARRRASAADPPRPHGRLS